MRLNDTSPVQCTAIWEWDWMILVSFPVRCTLSLGMRLNDTSLIPSTVHCNLGMRPNDTGLIPSMVHCSLGMRLNDTSHASSLLLCSVDWGDSMAGSIRKAMERGLCFLLLLRGEEEVSFITLAESHAGSGWGLLARSDCLAKSSVRKRETSAHCREP